MTGTSDQQIRSGDVVEFADGTKARVVSISPNRKLYLVDGDGPLWAWPWEVERVVTENENIGQERGGIWVWI